MLQMSWEVQNAAPNILEVQVVVEENWPRHSRLQWALSCGHRGHLPEGFKSLRPDNPFRIAPSGS
eukprot:3292196-Heterocapsa_arctica.AAC.1